jgi:YjjG family noncanonical pyrimidine nucleotidase
LQKPDFIYFDIDDTLLDHKQAQSLALRSVYEHAKLASRFSFERFDETYARINSGLWQRYSKGEITRETLEEERFSGTFRALGLNGGSPAGISEAYVDAYRNFWEWTEGAEEALEAIARTYPVGFITNGFTETQQLKARQFGLYSYGGPVIISEQVGHLKPSPQIFDYAGKMANTESSRILYVGDNFFSDVQGAGSAGWQTAWYTTEKDPQRLSRATLTFGTFSELSGFLLQS